MGKAFHYSILPFFKDKIFHMHNKVHSIKNIPNNYYYIFEIARLQGLPKFKVVFSDAYLFTENDYYELLNENVLKKGDFILIARPESNYNDNLLEQIYKDGFYIGKASFLVKFLNNNIDYINSYMAKEIDEINKKKKD